MYGTRKNMRNLYYLKMGGLLLFTMKYFSIHVTEPQNNLGFSSSGFTKL